jgi:HlyD family secretion protein
VSKANRAIRRHLALGGVTAAVLVFGIGGWAATTELSGAVIAPGFLVVESNVKKVQHPTGGVVGELHVKDGDHVEAGQILIRLDGVQTRSALAIVVGNLGELGAREARLLAERDDAAEIAFPANLLERSAEPGVGRLLAGERRLFDLRRKAREGQKAQLAERSLQLGQEIEGCTGQAVAKRREIDLIATELEAVRGLWAKNLVPRDRLTALERNDARLEGERGQLIATSAQAKGKITETELQVIQIDQDLRSEVARELADIRQKTTELLERRTGAEDLLKRVDIRAPQAGVVHELAAHTIGGVIAAGEPIMLIVPASDRLAVEAKITPGDIDQLVVGQPARLHFSAFSRDSTPELNGEVSLVAADTRHDERTGLAYYSVRIRVPESERSRLGGVKLVPGMPVDVFLETAPRTVASYLFKPMRDQVEKAFRD